MAKNARKKKPRSGERDDLPGLAVRRVAADIVEGVLNRHRALDEMLEGSDARAATAALAALDDRDRGLTRAIVAVVLRRLGTLRYLLGSLLEEGPPAQAPRVETALLIGAAQILFLEVPDHAAVDLAVRLAREDRMALHFAGLVNAVLRRIAREGKERIAALDAPVLDTPPWLMARWIKTYGEATAHAIAAANGREPALDLTVKSRCRKLGRQSSTAACCRPVRCAPSCMAPSPRCRVSTKARGGCRTQQPRSRRGFSAMSQACASPICARRPAARRRSLLLPARKVTAVDRAPGRLKRLQENLTRLSLEAELVCADVAAWTPEQHFDAVLLDAPCTSTGTIRRHPDVPWLKRSADITSLAAAQRRLLDHAITLIKPGGKLVYCTCSLEPEEGTEVVADLLAREQSVRRVPITAAEVFGQTDFIHPDGDLRTLPCHFTDADSRFAGVDGFYAARLEKL